MKKLSTSLIMMAAFATLISFNACKKKPKDADIKAAIETALKADPAASTASVSVEKGVATITGDFTDQATKDKLTSLVKGVKGVTDVVNNGVVSAPLPVINADDEALTKGLTDALKDHPGLSYSINDGKVVLTGTIAKAKWAALKQTLDKLKSKGYDLTGLTIK